MPSAHPALSPSSSDPRRAIHETVIVCLVCGHAFRQLTNSHLRSHGLTTGAYKTRFGYNRRRPLMSQALRRLYAERATRSRLASLIRSRPILNDPELRRRAGRRPIALEEMLTRRDARRRPAGSAAVRAAASRDRSRDKRERRTAGSRDRKARGAPWM
jgi:hypothetical protein